MDVRYINPFLSAAMEVLETMAMVKVTPGKPFLKKDEEAKGDVSGIIGLTGEKSGSLSVTFSFKLIQEVMKNMLGDEVASVTNEVKDAVGEITNMISGSARRRLSEEGLNLQAGIPTVVSGRSHSIKHVTSGPILVIPFSNPQGTLSVEVALTD